MRSTAGEPKHPMQLTAGSGGRSAR